MSGEGPTHPDSIISSPGGENMQRYLRHEAESRVVLWKSMRGDTRPGTDARLPAERVLLTQHGQSYIRIVIQN